MYKQSMNVAKSVGLGLLTGAAAAAVSAKVMGGGNKTAANMKKSASKAIHTVENVLGDVERMLR